MSVILNLNGADVSEIKLKSATGKHINLLDLKEDDFPIDYLAHTLSLTNRFGGHTPYGYSVATHSVVVSLLLPGYLQFEGLMHDATEGTGIGDLITQMKSQCPEYHMIEDAIRFQLSKIFGFSHVESKTVKAADIRAFQLEDAWLRGAYAEVTEMEAEIANHFIGGSIAPEKSAELFLAQFHYLRGHGTRPEFH